MHINIPDEVARTLGETESAVTEEITVALYVARKVSLAKGARLLGVDRVAFQQVLARHGIPMHYSSSSLAEDIEQAQRLVPDPPRA